METKEGLKHSVLWFDFGDKGKVKIILSNRTSQVHKLREKLRKIESASSWDLFKEQIKPIEKH